MISKFALAPLLLSGLLVLAQGNPDTEPMPITVAAQPAVAYAGRPVMLDGDTLGHPQLNTVTLKVDGPSGTTTLRVAAGLDGHYALQYDATKAAGKYSVTATAPDGRGTVTTRFDVLDAAAASSESGEAVTELVQTAAEIINAAQEKITSLPPSPAKDEALQKFATLQQKMAGLQRDMPEVRQGLAQLFDADRQLPSRNPRLDGDRDALVKALGEARAASARARAHLPSMHATRTTCDDLEVVIEGFKYTSFLLNLAGGGVGDVAENFSGDLVGYILGHEAEARGRSEERSYLASWWGKQGTNVAAALTKEAKFLEGLKGAVTGTVGTVSDLSGMLAGKAMDKYCEQFTGLVKAHMLADFYQDGEKWWEYSFDLLGKVSLHYPKSASGSIVALAGRIEGYGYNFKVWENALNVLFPDLMPSTLQKKVVVLPFSLGATGARIGGEYIEGSVVGAAMPNAFFFAATGTASKDKLRIDVGAARTDMDPKARVVAFTLSPLAMKIIPEVYVLPEKNAHFVFERTSAVYEIPIATVDNVVRGKQHFENDVGHPEAKGHYTVDIEVCNPKC